MSVLPWSTSKSEMVSDKSVHKTICKWSKPKCTDFQSSWLHGPRLVVIHHLRYPGSWDPGNSRGPIRSQACGPIRSQAWGPIRSQALGPIRKQSRGKTFPVRHSSCLGTPETVFVNLLRNSGIDNTEGKPYLLYRPTRLHRLAESIPRTRFLGSLNAYKYVLWAHSSKHLSQPISTLLKILNVLLCRNAKIPKG